MVQNLFSASGVFWSGLLISVALTKSPSVMRPCVIIIVIKSTIDLVASIANFIVTERIVSTGVTMFIISEGSLNSYLYCFSSHIFLSSLLQQNLVWLICSYMFRYYILNYRDLSLKIFIFAAILTYFPFLIHSLIWVKLYDESITKSEQYAPKTFSKPKDLVMAGRVVNDSSFYILSLLAVTSILTFAVYIWIRYMLMKFLKEKTSRLSKTAIVLNSQLVKAINFQCLIPILTFTGIILLFFMHYSVIDPYLIQTLPSIFFSSTLSIFPLSYILFMPPYYNFCLGNPKKEATRRIKATLRPNSIVETIHPTTSQMYPLSTF